MSGLTQKSCHSCPLLLNPKGVRVVIIPLAPVLPHKEGQRDRGNEKLTSLEGSFVDLTPLICSLQCFILFLSCILHVLLGYSLFPWPSGHQCFCPVSSLSTSLDPDHSRYFHMSYLWIFLCFSPMAWVKHLDLVSQPQSYTFTVHTQALCWGSQVLFSLFFIINIDSC